MLRRANGLYPNSHYIEISSFYILKSINEYINIEPDYFENFKKSLLKDIAEYQTIKVFKAVKRVWSLARITDDNKTLELLKDLIKSNISLLSQINADVETLILLIEHKSNYDIKFVINELDGFSEKLSTILDIELDFEKINLIIDNIKLLFQFKNIPLPNMEAVVLGHILKNTSIAPETASKIFLIRFVI